MRLYNCTHIQPAAHPLNTLMIFTGLIWCLFTHSGRMSSFSRWFSQRAVWVGGYRTCSRRLWASPRVCSLASAWHSCPTRFPSQLSVSLSSSRHLRLVWSTFFHLFVSTPTLSSLLPVGSPIPVPKCVTPTEEEVDHYHRLYMEGLSKLFHDHKVSCGLSESHKLRII